MMFARSGTPPQSYFDHVFHVLIRGRGYLRKMLHYARGLDAPAWRRIFEIAAEYHDLGKLEVANQKILKGAKKGGHLPIPHADAGVAAVAQKFGDDAWYAQLFIHAHHAGLKDFAILENEGLRNKKIEADTDNKLPQLLGQHEQEVRSAIHHKTTPLTVSKPFVPQDVRAIFGCLTHADHSDAARADGQRVAPHPPKLRAKERLAILENYVKNLPDDGDQRNQLRAEYFMVCASADHEESIIFSDGPVGVGKTTALMAQLLRAADKHGLRRIFVILPFTSIIQQSVEVYRKALVFPGENPADVVAEIHHRADFEDDVSRKLTALWDAPIIVTTAVAFFETFASASPATLRRLQNLPGSAIFLDEAHAMLPVKLLPLAWRWIRHAADEWSCRWVLASGSLYKFWELDEFRQGGAIVSVPNLVPQGTISELNEFELQRVTYRYRPELLTVSGVVEWLATLPGPVIAVFNTVHTAAAAAKAAADGVFGKDNVLHISTALTPADRDQILKKIRQRLKDSTDTRWCLIATSCVEAGVDFSFRTGVRECASLLSLLQLAGRVNRNAKQPGAEVWSFKFAADRDVIKNPAFETSADILWKLLEKGKVISPVLCTEAFKDELRKTAPDLKTLADDEDCARFATVEEKFRVIPNYDTRTVLIDQGLVAKVKDWKSDVSWTDIQRHSVSIRVKLIEQLACQDKESERFPGLFLWSDNMEYSPFLGYMTEVLKQKQINRDGLAII